LVTGVLWERRSVFGLETSSNLVAGLEVVDFEIPILHPFKDPFSIVALGGVATKYGSQVKQVEHAPDVFENTLIGMWAHGWIEVRQTITYQSYFGLRSSRGREYLLYPGRIDNLSELDGFLERRILEAVYTAQGDNAHIGITIKALMREIYPKDERKPSRWLLQWVQKNAVKHGVGVFSRRGPFQRFELNPAFASPLQQQYQVLQELHAQFSQNHTGLMKVFQRDIRIGLRRAPSTFI
jgi:hypothetical protein